MRASVLFVVVCSVGVIANLGAATLAIERMKQRPKIDLAEAT